MAPLNGPEKDSPEYTLFKTPTQNNMTPESIQAMIDHALFAKSPMEMDSHNSTRIKKESANLRGPCFYADFMKCKPLNFKGTKGVVGLTRWIEKMESVFNISGYAIENQVKFATCTLLGAALTWWNGQIRTLGPEAYAMTWEVLKKKMTAKYCPQDNSKVNKYISDLPDTFMGKCNSARPKELDETFGVRPNDLMDQKLRTYAERQSDNKRKADDSSRTTMVTSNKPSKRQMLPCYNIGEGKGSLIGRSLPKCTVAIFSNNGRAPRQCHKCNQRLFKIDCPKLMTKEGGKNRNATRLGLCSLGMQKRVKCIGKP
ncbi:hypothetical protein Tco_0579551 [Tanacetum coccineum]